MRTVSRRCPCHWSSSPQHANLSIRFGGYPMTIRSVTSCFASFAKRSTIPPRRESSWCLHSFVLHSDTSPRLSQMPACAYEVVHGEIPDEDRYAIRARFRKPFIADDAIDVLLSTEVGAEGLDYEFCDRLVNYDIPWNPMKVEQRIGRIDRFGQHSEKVMIFNFVTPGTVEERVFARCFERIGIFRDTVGDLEEILGDTVQALNRLASDPTLTPEQAEERAQQEADNLLRRAEEQRRLEAETPNFLA